MANNEERQVVMENQGEDVRVLNNDMVPDPWKGLFSNEEWLMHDIVVKSTYGFLIIAIIAHTLVFVWQPWLP